MGADGGRRGWLTDEDGVRYPPAPWHLLASGCASLWRVPDDALPGALGAAGPPGWAPLRVGGRALVGVAFLRYQPGGVLSYGELLVGVVVRRGARLRLTVPRIWVDSPASRAGGRALWGIPKDLAELALAMSGAELRAAARSGGRELATLRGRPSIPLPTAVGRIGGTLVQPHEEGERHTRVRALGGLRLGRARWRFLPDGPLGFLAGRAPLAHLVLEDAPVVVGGARRSPQRPRPGSRARNPRRGWSAT